MAGFMDSINKGLTTINVKTSNMMEGSKLKTAISTKESEIAAIQKLIGETVYINRTNFNMDMIKDQLASIEGKYTEIDGLKRQIAELEEKEKAILGDGSESGEAKIFCTQCGAPNSPTSKFCKKCGMKIEV